MIDSDRPRKTPTMGRVVTRDLDRISRMLTKLCRLWESQPDMTLGRLVIDTTLVMSDGKTDLYRLEEDRMEDAIDIALVMATVWIAEPDGSPSEALP